MQSQQYTVDWHCTAQTIEQFSLQIAIRPFRYGAARARTGCQKRADHRVPFVQRVQQSADRSGRSRENFVPVEKFRATKCFQIGRRAAEPTEGFIE